MEDWKKELKDRADNEDFEFLIYLLIHLELNDNEGVSKIDFDKIDCIIIEFTSLLKENSKPDEVEKKSYTKKLFEIAKYLISFYKDEVKEGIVEVATFVMENFESLSFLSLQTDNNESKGILFIQKFELENKTEIELNEAINYAKIKKTFNKFNLGSNCK